MTKHYTHYSGFIYEVDGEEPDRQDYAPEQTDIYFEHHEVYRRYLDTCPRYPWKGEPLKEGERLNTDQVVLGIEMLSYDEKTWVSTQHTPLELQYIKRPFRQVAYPVAPTDTPQEAKDLSDELERRKGESRSKHQELCAHEWVSYKSCCYCGAYMNYAGNIIPYGDHPQWPIKDLSNRFSEWYFGIKNETGSAPLAMQIFYWFAQNVRLFDLLVAPRPDMGNPMPEPPVSKPDSVAGKIVYVPTPISERPEKEGWYMVKFNNEEGFSEREFRNGLWSSKWLSAMEHWLKPVDLASITPEGGGYSERQHADYTLWVVVNKWQYGHTDHRWFNTHIGEVKGLRLTHADLLKLFIKKNK